MEKTKQRLDKFFTLRGLYSEFFKMHDFSSDKYRNVRRVQMIVPMPRLTDKQERIIIYKLIDADPNVFVFPDVISYDLLFIILMLHYDYSNGEHVIIDWTGLTTKHLDKFDVEKLSKALNLHLEAYSQKLLSVNFINLPGECERMAAIFKPIVKPEVFNLIEVHRDLSTLYKTVPKEYLPVEMGGSQRSMRELHEEWDNELRCHSRFFKDHAGLVSDESKRIGKHH